MRARPPDPSRSLRRAAAALALGALLASACGAAHTAVGDSADVDAAVFQRLRLDAQAAAEKPYQLVRHNPAPDACRCPEFEVLVGETWWRVLLEAGGGSPGPIETLRAEAALGAGDPFPVWYVIGSLDDDPVVACPNGAFGLELRVVSVRNEQPPIPGADP